MAAPHAALILGTLADALAWEDCSPTGQPSTCAVPCAWLAAEERHKSGRKLIAAIIAAYEVYQRIALAVQPSEGRWREKGWGMQNWQIFAAIIPIAKLYGLDTRKINQAVGMGCECSVIPTNFAAATMSDFSHYEYGYRGRDGFLIAKAVEKGIYNQRDALDDPRCYTGIVCGDESANGDDETKIHADESDRGWLTRELGTRCLILETMLRRWPAGIWAQSSAELAHMLQQKYAFSPEQVEEILVDPPVEGYMDIPREGLILDIHAQNAIPFVVASVLTDPVPGAHWYSSGRMRDTKLLALAQRVKPGPSQAQSVISNYQCFQKGSYPNQRMIIKLKDGTQYQAETDCPRGHPGNMPDMQEQIKSFHHQAKGVLPEEKICRLTEAICTLEDCRDIAEISALLSPQNKK